MNVFEDLIEELKEENLIEETVIETSRAEMLAADKSSQSSFIAPEIAANISSSPQTYQTNQLPETATESKQDKKDSVSDDNSPQVALKTANKTTLPVKDETVSETDFYRRRATEEVTSLKIVEHIISGVEREVMKIAPKSYDDLAVGIALHDFLHITADPSSPEHSISEFKLIQETENWYSALARRDKFVTVGDLRRYCETTRPVLSLQALIALARFYRNAPFYEDVRSKFDMVMTRLLTKETKNSKRQLVFERQKLVEQIAGLYQDWSSIPLYADEDDSEVLLAVLKFEDFISEIEKADSFEKLINTEFFNRLRVFKDNIGENFFSPLLLATAIECNVAVGNRYVELIESEREKNNSEILEEKYQSLLDLTVSDATNKTLQLIDLLKAVKEEEDEPETPQSEEKIVSDVPETPEETDNAKVESAGFMSLKVNKWLLVAALLVIALIGGLYIWIEYFSASPETSAGVERVTLEGTKLQEYFKAARINDNTYYAITQPIWKDLARETKETALKNALADGAQKGYTKVVVLNGDGKTVGFASAQKGIEIADF